MCKDNLFVSSEESIEKGLDFTQLITEKQDQEQMWTLQGIRQGPNQRITQGSQHATDTKGKGGSKLRGIQSSFLTFYDDIFKVLK